LNYLVNIDSEGKLRWARNDELVDTTPGRWKDAGNGQGIIPDDIPETSGQIAASIASPRSSFSGEEGEAANHYIGPAKGKTKATRAFRKYLTIHGIVDKLLKKTVRRNTWIYVSVRLVLTYLVAQSHS
ncbi:uncharacterized protein STEHIDRAFT_48127, partial [Stereum hirsutum FP-91666 SS1]|uniref:uncharacterized protein n=1 Tax=Stereum hirsutum (strain FP-91666) TaxID=721885 RepID=UPI000440EC05